MTWFSYITEFEDEDGGTQTREWGSCIVAARGYARRSSAKHSDRIVYVVAIEERFHDCERVGAEGYANGRRDTVEGRMGVELEQEAPAVNANA